MTPVLETCNGFAGWLARQALWPTVVVAAVLAAAPLAALAGGVAPNSWPAAAIAIVATVSGLAVLALSALIRFDAALFHLMASYEGETAGGAAVDDALARMRLKPQPEQTRSLAERMAGARRLVFRQRLALGVFAIAVTAAPLAFQP
ncbi:hypothetical protein [Mesorhizobium sp. WSM2239]|uniref:DUF1772 domain-containing protein n=2 Tax=unclassified Mesorhizobium TaxID=325217 RepID=A0AAU8DBW2_9HYPH